MTPFGPGWKPSSIRNHRACFDRSAPETSASSDARVTRRVEADDEIDGLNREGDDMVFLLVLAVVLFILGIFTMKILWWAAVILAAVWVIGMLRSRNRVRA